MTVLAVLVDGPEELAGRVIAVPARDAPARFIRPVGESGPSYVRVPGQRGPLGTYRRPWRYLWVRPPVNSAFPLDDEDE